MAQLIMLPPAARYLKKLKDRELKKRYQEAINRILDDYTVGSEKRGDLRGVRCYDIFYNRTNYELAYIVRFVPREDNGEPEAIIIIMAGTRENFYEELKRYMP